MVTIGAPAQPASRCRRVVFTLVGGLVGLALLTAAANVLAPWVDVNVENLADPQRARWSLALEGAVDLLLLVCLVAALVRPARSALLVQYLLYAPVLAAAVMVPFSPMFLINAGLLLLVPLTYPYPRELIPLRSPSGPSLVLLAVAVTAAAALVPVAARALSTQATLPRGNGSDFNVLATSAEHLLLLALAGLLTATRRPGWRFLALAVSATYAYLGIASMLLPHQPHSWGMPGGAACLLAAAAFAITAGSSAQRTQQAAPVLERRSDTYDVGSAQSDPA